MRTRSAPIVPTRAVAAPVLGSSAWSRIPWRFSSTGLERRLNAAWRNTVHSLRMPRAGAAATASALLHSGRSRSGERVGRPPYHVISHGDRINARDRLPLAASERAILRSSSTGGVGNSSAGGAARLRLPGLLGGRVPGDLASQDVTSPPPPKPGDGEALSPQGDEPGRPPRPDRTAHPGAQGPAAELVSPPTASSSPPAEPRATAHILPHSYRRLPLVHGWGRDTMISLEG
jgi:hypothetical protein